MSPDLAQAAERLVAGLHPARLLVISDFDGTLAEIVPHPSLVQANLESLSALSALAGAGASVAVVSGRGLPDLRRRIPVTGIRLVGDYGAGEVRPIFQRRLDRFNKEAIAATLGTGGWVEIKPRSTTIHFRGHEAAAGAIREAILPLAHRYGLSANQGKAAIEIRLPGVTKAGAVRRLIEAERPEAVVFLGDDANDLDALRLVKRLPLRHLAVGVDSPERPDQLAESSDLVVRGPAEAAALLTEIAARLGSRSARPDPAAAG